MTEEPKNKISQSPKLFEFPNNEDLQVTMVVKTNAGQPDRMKKQDKIAQSPWSKDK